MGNINTDLRKFKWRWPGHIARMKNERWAKILSGVPQAERDHEEDQPPRRWTDELVRGIGIEWMRGAQNRDIWKTLGEAYAPRGLPGSFITCIYCNYKCKLKCIIVKKK